MHARAVFVVLYVLSCINAVPLKHLFGLPLVSENLTCIGLLVQVGGPQSAKYRPAAHLVHDMIGEVTRDSAYLHSADAETHVFGSTKGGVYKA